MNGIEHHHIFYGCISNTNSVRMRKNFIPGSKKYTFSETSEVGVSFDENQVKHIGDSTHPECPDRVLEILKRLDEDKLLQRMKRAKSRGATDEELYRCHDAAYVQRIENLKEQFAPDDPDSFIVTKKKDIITPFGSDTYFREDTPTVARFAAGNAVSLVDEIMNPSSSVKRGFAIVRPPGHHANSERAQGFCIYNNAGVAAEHARVAHDCKRVVILDWDVHHGNGTQDIFVQTPNVTTISFHRHEKNYFPGTGAGEEIGTSAGKGFTLNVPLPKGFTDSDVFASFRNVIVPAIVALQPEFIVVSAGFDAADKDPLGECELTQPMFRWMTRQMMALANLLCQGRLLLVLEGGYEPVSVSQCVAQCVTGLLGDAPTGEAATDVAAVSTEQLTPPSKDKCLLFPPFSVFSKAAVQAHQVHHLKQTLLTSPRLAPGDVSPPVDELPTPEVSTLDDALTLFREAGVAVEHPSTAPFWHLSLSEEALVDFSERPHVAPSVSPAVKPLPSPAKGPSKSPHKSPMMSPKNQLSLGKASFTPLQTPCMSPAVALGDMALMHGDQILMPVNAIVETVIAQTVGYHSGYPFFLTTPTPGQPRPTKLRKQLAKLAASPAFGATLGLPEPSHICLGDSSADLPAPITLPLAPPSKKPQSTLLNLARTMSQDAPAPAALVATMAGLTTSPVPVVELPEAPSPVTQKSPTMLKPATKRELSLAALLKAVSAPLSEPLSEAVKCNLPEVLLNANGRTLEQFRTTLAWKEVRGFAMDCAPRVRDIDVLNSAVRVDNVLANMALPCAAEFRLGLNLCPPDFKAERLEKCKQEVKQSSLEALHFRVVSCFSALPKDGFISDSEARLKAQAQEDLPLLPEAVYHQNHRLDPQGLSNVKAISDFIRSFVNPAPVGTVGRSREDVIVLMRAIVSKLRTVSLWATKALHVQLVAPALLVAFDGAVANPASTVVVKVIDVQEIRPANRADVPFLEGLKSLDRLIKEAISALEHLPISLKPSGKALASTETVDTPPTSPDVEKGRRSPAKKEGKKESSLPSSTAPSKRDNSSTVTPSSTPPVKELTQKEIEQRKERNEKKREREKEARARKKLASAAAKEASSPAEQSVVSVEEWQVVGKSAAPSAPASPPKPTPQKEAPLKADAKKDTPKKDGRKGPNASKEGAENRPKTEQQKRQPTEKAAADKPVPEKPVKGFKKEGDASQQSQQPQQQKGRRGGKRDEGLQA